MGSPPAACTRGTCRKVTANSATSSKANVPRRHVRLKAILLSTCRIVHEVLCIGCTFTFHASQYLQFECVELLERGAATLKQFDTLKLFARDPRVASLQSNKCQKEFIVPSERLLYQTHEY